MNRHASGRGFSASTLRWVSSPASPWNFSSAPIGRSSRALPEASSASRWPWKALFLSSWSRHSWGCFCTAKNAWGNGDTGGWLPGVPRVMDLRVLYHRRRRMDAASSGLHAPVQWRVQCFQLLGTLDEPVGADSVRTQHERSRSHRAFLMASVGAFYLLQQKFVEHAHIF